MLQSKPFPIARSTLMSKRDNFPVDVPDVIIPYKLGDLGGHIDYQAAKAGDTIAAVRLANDLVTNDVAKKVASIGGNDVLLLPVLAEEGTGRNKIPLAIAKVLQGKTGRKVELSIYQVNKPTRTGLNGLDRIFAVPEFEGDTDLSGRSFLLVDDTLTQGGTFASLASHIRQNGGNVAGAMALTGKQFSARLKLDSSTLGKLKQQYGDIENDFREATGYGFDALTESEARYLSNYKPSQTVRDRILEERDAAISRRNG